MLMFKLKIKEGKGKGKSGNLQKFNTLGMS